MTFGSQHRLVLLDPYAFDSGKSQCVGNRAILASSPIETNINFFEPAHSDDTLPHGDTEVIVMCLHVGSVSVNSVMSAY